MSRVPVTRTTGSPGQSQRRTALLRQIKTLELAFITEPTMATVDKLEELRRTLTALEREIVLRMVNAKMFELAMADLVEVGDADYDDRDLEQAPHGY